MAAFPTLSSGTTAFYPVTETARFNTGVVRFLNATEQRWRRQAQLGALVVTWNNTSRADMLTILGVHQTLKGAYDAQTLSFPLGATTYDYVGFADDTLTITETKPNYFNIVGTFRQTRKN